MLLFSAVLFVVLLLSLAAVSRHAIQSDGPDGIAPRRNAPIGE